MKKIVVFILLAGMLCGLCACGQTETAAMPSPTVSAQPTAEPVRQEEKRLGVLLCETDADTYEDVSAYCDETALSLSDYKDYKALCCEDWETALNILLCGEFADCTDILFVGSETCCAQAEELWTENSIDAQRLYTLCVELDALSSGKEENTLQLSDGPIFFYGNEKQFTLSLYSMKTNEIKQVFSFDYQGKYSLAIDPSDVCNYFHSQLFDSSLSRIAVSWRENGEGHVGWLDQNGNLTDITNKVHPAGTGFTSQTPEDKTALFTSDNKLMFYDGNQNLYCYYDEMRDDIVETYDAAANLVKSYPLRGLDTDGRPTSKWMKCEDCYCLVDQSWVRAADVNDIVFYDNGPVFLGILNGRIKHYGCGLDELTDYQDYEGNSYIEDKGVEDYITPNSEYCIESLAYHDGMVVFTASRNNKTTLFSMPYTNRIPGDIEQVGEIDRSLGTIFFWFNNNIIVNEQHTETIAVSDKAYSPTSNLKIEGKWKSVGSYGFGQAQPGAIVVFDGNNCNFFSPKDTYAFSKDGDNYKLECTSFMSTDTLTFTVKTVDEDNIDIFYGDNVTELTRVN